MSDRAALQALALEAFAYACLPHEGMPAGRQRKAAA